MKKVIEDKSLFTGQFERFDYCLLTPVDDKLELIYFNTSESETIEKGVESKLINMDEKESILFCLNDISEFEIPKLKCNVAINRPNGLKDLETPTEETNE